MTHRSQPVRLTLMTSALGLGGLERVIETICTTIDRDRFEPSVLCVRRGGPVADRLTAQGIPVHIVREDPERSDRLAFLKVARLLRRMGTEVLHTHNTEAFIDGGLGGRLAGVRTVVHTDHARPFPDARRYMIAEYVLSHLVYRVVGVSEPSTDNLRRYERIPRRKLATILNGVDPAPYAQPIDRVAKRRELGLPERGPIIGTGARLTEQKGLADLIRTVPALRIPFPDLRVLIAGEGPLEGTLRQLAADLDVSTHVVFLGLRDDMAELLRLFDVYALPSVWEGLPMAVLEAMASECPLVASSVGGVPTAIVHDESGILIPPGDVAALTSGLQRVIEHPEEARRYAVTGRQRFLERFSARAMTRRYERLYLRRPIELDA